MPVSESDSARDPVGLQVAATGSLSLSGPRRGQTYGGISRASAFKFRDSSQSHSQVGPTSTGGTGTSLVLVALALALARALRLPVELAPLALVLAQTVYYYKY